MVRDSRAVVGRDVSRQQAEAVKRRAVRRVLFVVNTLPPVDISGVGEQVLQLAHGLQSRGIETRVLGRGQGGASGPKVLFPLTVLLPAWRAIRKERPDVVQVHESDGGLLALLLWIWRPRGVRRVALQQVSYRREMVAVAPVLDRSTGQLLARPNLAERRFKWWRGPVHLVLGWLTARCSEVTLAPSERTANELAEDYGVERAPVVPNATGAPLDTRADHEAGVPRGSSGSEQPVKSQMPVDQPREGAFLFVGRLRLRKGVEVLLEAVARLREEAVRVDVEIAGDGERRAELEARRDRLGLGDQVRFLGRLGAADVGRKLAGARALVVPSLYEGMPLVILEAMSHATPVIASAVSGIPEVVLDGETGWLVPSRDVVALSQALAEAWGSPAECQRRGLAGRERLSSCYGPGDAATAWLAALEERSS